MWMFGINAGDAGDAEDVQDDLQFMGNIGRLYTLTIREEVHLVALHHRLLRFLSEKLSAGP